MFLLFNMLSRFAIAFLPRSKYLLISWLQSPSVVILESKKIKSVTVSIVSPSICHEVMGPDAMIYYTNLLYKINSHTVKKVLGHTTDFPTWGSGKGTETSQGIWLWRPVGFNYRTYTGLGNTLLEGRNKILCAPRPRRKEQWPPQETDPDLPMSVQESPAEAWVSGGLLQGWGHWV